MKEMLLLCHQVIHDRIPVKGDHILVQFHSMREELSPVIVRLPVVIDEYRRIDPAAGKLYRILKRSLRAVGHCYSLTVILHTKIEIIFPVLLDAVRSKQKRRLFFFLLLFELRLHIFSVSRSLLQHLSDKRSRMAPVDPGILRRIRVIEPGDLIPGKGFLRDGPVFHIRC